ncbi:MAG: right-handed parallel beta-helix repeat-containing protein [bacterium]|nr:right-handed parallel beta-helix repeat-containing protein [bacterium]
MAITKRESLFVNPNSLQPSMLFRYGRMMLILLFLFVFSIRINATIYYVNDDTTGAEDVWCTAVGNDINSGLAASAPKRNINSIRDAYALAGGDEVRIDTGTYGEWVELNSGHNDNGTANNYLVFTGAGTNAPGGGVKGTKIDGGGSRACCFKMVNKKWIKIQNMRINASINGENINISSCTNMMITNCKIYQALDGSGNDSKALCIDNSSIKNKIINNKIGDNTDPNQEYGICIQNNSVSNFLYKNDIYKNGWSGIMLQQGAGSNTILSNTIHDGSSEGIAIRKNGGNSSAYNRITGNKIYLNNRDGVILDDDSNHTFIYGNIIYRNNQGGNTGRAGININTGSGYADIRNNLIYSNTKEANIKINSSRNCMISNNAIYACSGVDGERVGVGGWNLTNSAIINNKIYNNQLNGIKITDSSVNNKIYYNSVWNNGYSGSDDNQRSGIYIYNSDDNRVFRNISYQNRADGLRTQDSSDRIAVINNTFFKNGGRGVLFDGTSTSCTLRNNIAQSNTGEGFMRVVNATPLVQSYNNSFGNSGNNFDFQGDALGTGTISQDSLFQSTDPSATNFLYLSSGSPCVDTGDPNDPVPEDGGLRVDMGAIEYLYSPVLNVTKSVSNITLDGSNVRTIPGSTIEYKMHYTNSGLGAGKNVFIYDKVKSSIVTFQTSWGEPGWTMQWSTNPAPAQSYDSTDYKDTMPAKTNIMWVRWKKPALSYYSGGNFYIKVIIK